MRLGRLELSVNLENQIIFFNTSSVAKLSIHIHYDGLLKQSLNNINKRDVQRKSQTIFTKHSYSICA